MTAREQWKAFYRQMRIVRREASDALAESMNDMLCFGTGAVEVTADGHVRHFPANGLIAYLAKLKPHA